ncbi:Uncharacterized protein DAT39_005601 [Clarias magur]|uniref:Uncharacterized protein n=1 Tax=Clarias magur TaxID=1594786 RepID=A0A8J4X5K7_CLAMG|nr:Uncharacterized protein DAT39_005601 [Clarias magur]
MSLYLAGLRRRNADHEMPVSFGLERTSSLPGTPSLECVHACVASCELVDFL